MLPNWRGPMRVISFNDDTYCVQNLITDKIEKVHVKRLKQFIYDPVQTDPATVAQVDDQSFVIEKIIQHTGNPRKKLSMDFKVRWAGYGPDDDLWLPWSEIRGTEALREYLQGNKHLRRNLNPN